MKKSSQTFADPEASFVRAPASSDVSLAHKVEQLAILEAAAEKLGAVKQSIALDAFCRFRFGGKNFDQVAGFKNWVKNQKQQHLDRKEESAWISLLEEFQNKRIGG